MAEAADPVAAGDMGVCCSPGCGVVLQKRRECPICKQMGIAGSFFCSKECYKKNWQKHKKIHQTHKSGDTGDDSGTSCASKDGEKEESSPNASSATVISLVPGDAQVSLVTLMRAYQLKNYGNYGGEKSELRSDLGWKSIGEIKFYPKTGCQWYFFGYYDRDAKKKKERLNKAVSVATGVDVYGQCVILPSGPMGSESYTNGLKIKFVDLAETLAFYRDKDPEMVFQEREASRAVGPELLLGGFGMGGEGCYMGGMPAFKTNAKKGSSSMVFTSKH